MTGKALSTALLALTIPCLALGCTASASFQSGGAAQPSAAPPPPPPPPPADPAPATPAPVASAEPTPAAPTPATPVATTKPSVAKDSITLPGAIEFESGKATFKAGGTSEATLAQLKQFLDENPRITKLRIEGHTDNVGAAATNETLSGERAVTIKKFLIEKGIVKERLLATGFGQTRPIADNSTEDGRAKNRRTEFRIAELSGKAYLGRDPSGGGKVFE
ncbi:MAG: OmpA family protein [Polyangiaceae bacterium]